MATIGRVRFPVVLFDLDGTVVDSGGIILASMRHATRTVLGREIPDEALMATVGGPGLEAQMREFGGESQVEELVRVYRAHNEPLHSEPEVVRRHRRRSDPAQGGGATARPRLGQAARDGRARVRSDRDRAPVRRRRRRRRGRAPEAGPGHRCCSRSSGSARGPRTPSTSATRRSTWVPPGPAGCTRSGSRGAGCTTAVCSPKPTSSSTRRRSCLPSSDASSRAAELRERLAALVPRVPRPRRADRRGRRLRPRTTTSSSSSSESTLSWSRPTPRPNGSGRRSRIASPRSATSSRWARSTR